MNKISVLIVDDEPIAQEILENYLARIPYATLAGKCRNAIEAFQVVSKTDVDLLLLDINMPEITGIEFLKTLKNPPKVIFTTAYTEYAVESYDLYAVDYLLKPISFDRFFKAITKAMELIATKPASPFSKSTESADHILFVKTEGKLVKVDLRELWFIEGLKDYVRLWTSQGNW